MQTTSYSCAITKQGYQPMPAFWHVSGNTTLISNLREDSVGCSGQTLVTSRIFQNTPDLKTPGFFVIRILQKVCAQRERPGTINIRCNVGVLGDEKSVAKTQMVKTQRNKAFSGRKASGFIHEECFITHFG